MTAAALILAAMLAAQNDDWRPATPLDWLHGTWVCRESGAGDEAVLRRERWQPDDWSGTHVRVDETGGGRTEALPLATGRILAGNGGFTLSHRMRGALGGAPASYHSIRVGARRADFVTGEAVEPQRIGFRRTSTSLIVTHSRRDGSGARSWHMRREGDPGGYRRCDSGR